MHLDNANQQLSSVITTFQGMIRLSEIESGRQKQYFKQVNLSELLSEISESYEPVFTDQHRELEISVVDNVYCMGDQDLLNQLVCNLLENSLEHGRQNGKTWLRLQSHRKGALLQIGDDGPGISPQHRHHIFERFYRADISRGKEGNGLGLSIVKAICSLHEGQISLLENQQGAVFDIELPTQTRT